MSCSSVAFLVVGSRFKQLMGAFSFSDLISRLRDCAAALPDSRKGANTRFTMADIALSAFSIFFMQCPSFLAFQQSMQRQKGRNNAQSLFGIEKIPSDNHVRDILDPIAPEQLFGMFDEVYQAYGDCGLLESMRQNCVNNFQLIALDGTRYFSSQSENIHCSNCSCSTHSNGTTTHYHVAITPVIVAPGRPEAVALKPEFIRPQDGNEKQDCEINAGKRWLAQHAEQYNKHGAILLGDDLYAHQPFCRQVLLHGFHFIFTCKPSSHVHLSRWIDELDGEPELQSLRHRLKNRQTNQFETWSYRWVNNAPLAEESDALKVNWCEVIQTGKGGKVLYRNTFITDLEITEQNVAAIVASGRSRWKIENENNNTLKTKGYNLEHNFGHGKMHLSSLLATMNLLAFAMHGLLDHCDAHYRLIRRTLVTRQTFFDDIRALTRYHCFASWIAMMDFMMKGLEIGPYESQG